MDIRISRKRAIESAIHSQRSVVVSNLPVSEQDEILSMLYAPDMSGLPDISLGMVLSGKARPELQQFVDANLLRSLEKGQYSDADTALELTPMSEFQLGREREIYSSQVVNLLKDYKKRLQNVE